MICKFNKNFLFNLIVYTVEIINKKWHLFLSNINLINKKVDYRIMIK
jgi:hypothetical protein